MSKTIDKLIRVLNIQDVWSEANLDDPEWDKAERVHDWRNHVPRDIKGLWSQLPLEARIVAVIFAEQAASDEEWD